MLVTLSHKQVLTAFERCFIWFFLCVFSCIHWICNIHILHSTLNKTTFVKRPFNVIVMWCFDDGIHKKHSTTFIRLTIEMESCQSKYFYFSYLTAYISIINKIFSFSGKCFTLAFIVRKFLTSKNTVLYEPTNWGKMLQPKTGKRNFMQPWNLKKPTTTCPNFHRHITRM